MTFVPRQKSFQDRIKPLVGEKILTYDLEGTGLSTRHDVPFQFAAVLQSKSGEILSTHEFHGRLPNFTIPSAKALLVTGKRISDIQSANLSHYDFVGKIHSLLDSVSPATITSYNGIRYDEELLRHNFFGTLRQPYVTQFGNNQRRDIYKAVQAVPAVYPGALDFILNDRGKHSMKLEHVAAANGFNSHNAHDALSDVHATIYVADQLKSKAPRVWAACAAWQDKDRMIALLASGEPIVQLGWNFHASEPVAHVLIPATFDDENPNECICVSVEADIDGLRRLAPTDLKAKFRSYKGLTPLRRIKANAMPTIAPLRSALAQMAGVSSSLDALPPISSDLEFQARLREANALRKAEFDEPEHVRDSLYSGSFFPKDADAALVREFHAAAPDQKFAISQRFQDERAKELAFLLIGSEWRETLPAAERIRYDEQLYYHLTAEEAPWTTIPSALTEIEELSFDANQEEMQILEEYHDFLIGYWDGAIV